MTDIVIQDLTLHSADDAETLSRIKVICEEIILSCMDDLGITEVLEIKPLQWNFILTEIRDKLFKVNPYILHDIPNINNTYNQDKVLSIYNNIFLKLSKKYNQEITFMRFIYFTGIEKQCLYNWSNNKAKQEGLGILERIRADSEECLSDMLIDRSVNSLGVIAKLNHVHGWKDDNKTTTNINFNISDSANAIGQRYHAKLTDSKPDNST